MTATAGIDLVGANRDQERRDNFGLGLTCVLAFVIGGLFLAPLAGYGLLVFRRAQKSIRFVGWMSFFYGLIGWTLLALAVAGII